MYRILFNTIYLGSPQKNSAVRLFQNNNIPLSRFLLYWSRPLRFGALGEICAYSFVRKWPVVQVAVVKRTGNKLPFIALMSYSTGLCRGWAAKILLAMTASPFFRSIWAAFDFCRERFLRDLDSASEPVPTFSFSLSLSLLAGNSVAKISGAGDGANCGCGDGCGRTQQVHGVATTFRTVGECRPRQP